MKLYRSDDSEIKSYCFSARDCNLTYGASSFGRICQLLQRSPSLVEVTIKYLKVSKFQSGYHLLRALSGLTHLEELDLLLHAPLCIEHWISPHLASACPSSLESFALSFTRFHDEGVDTESSAVMHDAAHYDGLLPTHPVVLHRLKRVSIESLGRRGLEDISYLFQRLPSLEYLGVPYHGFSENFNDVAGRIIRNCPALQCLQLKLKKSDHGYSLALALVSAMSKGQLKELVLNTKVSPESSDALICRHTTSLRRIELGRGADIKSRSIQTIIQMCYALEELIVSSGHTHAAFLTLDGAVEEPWSCTKLRCLEITFGFEAEGLFAKGDAVDMFYNRTGSVVLTTKERRGFSKLERLYRQIGALKDLELLQLEATSNSYRKEDEARDHLTIFQEKSLPGFLSLGDPVTDRPGYLKLLQGITKLRNIHGLIFAMTNPEQDKTVSWEEVCWIRRHWQLLRQADFSTYRSSLNEPSEDLKEEFEWLYQQKPNLVRSRKAPSGWFWDYF